MAGYFDGTLGSDPVAPVSVPLPESRLPGPGFAAEDVSQDPESYEAVTCIAAPAGPPCESDIGKVLGVQTLRRQPGCVEEARRAIIRPRRPAPFRSSGPCAQQRASYRR
jgi:hypothetical protein